MLISSNNRLFLWLFLVSSYGLSHPTGTVAFRTGLPALFSIEGSLWVGDNLEAVVQVSPISPAVFVNSNTLKLTQYIAGARMYLTSGFFVAGFLGLQNFSCERTTQAEISIASSSALFPATSRVDIKSIFLTPQLGYTWRWDCFFLALELGAVIPIHSTTALSAVSSDPLGDVFISAIQETEAYKELEKEVANQGNRLGKTVLPWLTLVRVGWAF